MKIKQFFNDISENTWPKKGNLKVFFYHKHNNFDENEISYNLCLPFFMVSRGPIKKLNLDLFYSINHCWIGGNRQSLQQTHCNLCCNNHTKESTKCSPKLLIFKINFSKLHNSTSLILPTHLVQPLSFLLLPPFPHKKAWLTDTHINITITTTSQPPLLMVALCFPSPAPNTLSALLLVSRRLTRRLTRRLPNTVGM